MAFTTRDGRTQTALAEINMVPFIDIMLVLLIIFMITAPVIQSGIEIDVPQTQTVNELTQQNLEVSIDSQQTVYLQGEPININELGPEIVRRMPEGANPSVYLRADQSVAWGSVSTVLDRLTLSGITNVNVVTRPIDN
jgi:biopolymer transport protein ExbD/biopolymer transport protein TolR